MNDNTARMKAYVALKKSLNDNKEETMLNEIYKKFVKNLENSEKSIDKRDKN